MPGGYSHNIPETLKLIDLYYNSQFKTGKYDDLGFRKFFFNVVKPACDIATKFVDLDTKDIILTPESDQSEFKVWFLQKKLKQYLKNENFGIIFLINKLLRGYKTFFKILQPYYKFFHNICNFPKNKILRKTFNKVKNLIL